MTSQPVRFGILGSATIARKNWKAIRLSGNGRVSAVASRSAAKAQAFIDECAAEVPQAEQAVAVGSYEDLIACDDVDASGLGKHHPGENRDQQCSSML